LIKSGYSKKFMGSAPELKELGYRKLLFNVVNTVGEVHDLAGSVDDSFALTMKNYEGY